VFSNSLECMIQNPYLTRTPLATNFLKFQFCWLNTCTEILGSAIKKTHQDRFRFHLSTLPDSPLFYQPTGLLRQPFYHQLLPPATALTSPAVHNMADKAAPKAMGRLSNREQEILVAALSKCLKNGDIQASQAILPYPSILELFS
jgi:hypothetical protein